MGRGTFFDKQVDRPCFTWMAILWWREKFNFLSGTPIWKAPCSVPSIFPARRMGVGRLGLDEKCMAISISGVLPALISRQWRRVHALDTLLEFVANTSIRFMVDPDQDALNACFHDHPQTAGLQMECHPPILPRADLGAVESCVIEAVRRDVRMIHYNVAVPSPGIIFVIIPQV